MNIMTPIDGAKPPAPYRGGKRVLATIFCKNDYEVMALQLSNIQGRFILSINDTPEIRDIFADFEMTDVPLTYSIV